MMALFHWIIIGQALIVFAFVMIYASGFAGGGVVAGIRLGVLLEIAAIGMRMGFYAVQPFPGKLIIYGSISGLIEMIIVGALSVGSINRRHARIRTKSPVIIASFWGARAPRSLISAPSPKFSAVIL
jgi:hypothetical protein